MIKRSVLLIASATSIWVLMNMAAPELTGPWPATVQYNRTNMNMGPNGLNVVHNYVAATNLVAEAANIGILQVQGQAKMLYATGNRIARFDVDLNLVPGAADEAATPALTMNPTQFITDPLGNQTIRSNALLTNMVLKGQTLVQATGAPIARPLEDRFSESINVLDYGATIAAGNDDTTNCQAAIVAAQAANKPVYFPPGNYHVSTLTLLAPIYGLGDGTVIEPTVSLAIINSGISVKHLKINSFSHVGLHTTNVFMTNIVIDDVTFTFDSSVTNMRTGPFAWNSALAFTSEFTDGLVITHCRAYRGGFQVNRANNLLFTDNYIDGGYNNWNELLHSSANSRTIVTDNVFLQSFGDPIDIYSSGSGCRIMNNIFDGWGDPTITTNTDGLVIPLGVNEAVITLKVVLTDNANSSGPLLGYTENTVIAGNTFRNGRPTINLARVFGIMLKTEDLRTNAVALWDPQKSSKNVLIQHNIFDGFWTNNPGLFETVFFAGVHADGTGIDISHNVFRDISMQGSGLSASSTAGVELGFYLGTTNGTACLGCTVTHNIYEGEGTGIIVYNTTNSLIAANIVREDPSKMGFTNALKPRYGMVINGNMHQTTVRDNQFDPTFLNPSGIIQLGTTNYIDDCIFDGNYSTKRTSLSWYLPRVRFSTLNNNRIGTLTFGNTNEPSFGNILRNNSVFGNVGLPGFDLYSQKNFQVIGNIFTNTLRAINMSTDPSGLGMDVGIITENFSLAEGGTFIDVGNVAVTPLTRIIRFNNFANNTLRTSGGNMNLGGVLNTGTIISSGQIQVPVNQSYGWTSGSFITSTLDGYVTFFNSSVNNFSGLYFGGATANNMAMFIVTNTATGGFHFKAGNNSHYTNIYAKNITLSDLGAGVGQMVVVGPNGMLTNAPIPSASGYTTIQEEGSSVTARSILNFIGTGVTAIDNAGKTEVTIDNGIRVKETDGTPDIAVVREIRLPSGMLTDNGLGVATITPFTITRHLVLALSNPTTTTMTAAQTNYFSLPVGITIQGVRGSLLKAGTSDTILILQGATTGAATNITTITLGNGVFSAASGTVTGASYAANKQLIGIISSVGTGSPYGAQIVVSYTTDTP